MTKRKLMIGMASAAVMAGVSFPAGAEEPSVILDRMNAALEKAEYFEGTAGIKMPVFLEAGGISAEVPAEINGNFQIDTGNRKATMTFVLDAGMEGETEETGYEIYIQNQMLYISENGGEWMIQEMGSAEDGGSGQEGMLSGIFSALGALTGNMSVKENTVEVDGTECYEVYTDVPSKRFLEIMGEMADISDAGIMEDTELELYVGTEDYLPREMRTGFVLHSEIDDEEGRLSCSVVTDIRITSYEPQEIVMPEEIQEADISISDAGELEKTDVREIPADDDYRATKESVIWVSCGNGNGITFELSADMENTTYDKTLTDYFCFSADNAELTVEADNYYNAARNLESDRNFYMEGEYSDGFMDAEEFGFSVPAGSVSGIFFKSVDDGMISYTSALAYIDIEGACYKFDYTVFEEAESEEMLGFLRKTCESIQTAG